MNRDQDLFVATCILYPIDTLFIEKKILSLQYFSVTLS